LLRAGTSQANGPIVIRYGPFVDGEVIPLPLYDSLEAGLKADTPILVSNTTEEAGVYDCWGAVDHAYAIVAADADQSVDHAEKVRVLSEIRWIGPAMRLLEAAHKGGGRGWAQRFDYVPTTNWSAALAYPIVATRPVHGADIASLFLDPEGPEGSDTDRAVAALDQGALLALARDGRAPWAEWTPEQETVHRIAAPES
jgi:para-nitrobenzyl esterase